jgi:hypothetical protein
LIARKYTHLDATKALLDSPHCPQRGHIALRAHRGDEQVAAPEQLIRIATKAANSDDAARRALVMAIL